MITESAGERTPMSQNQIQNRWLSTSPATPSMLGVRPDARLAFAFLTQAFVWMFAGLLLSAGVAWMVIQSNE